MEPTEAPPAWGGRGTGAQTFPEAPRGRGAVGFAAGEALMPSTATWKEGPAPSWRSRPPCCPPWPASTPQSRARQADQRSADGLPRGAERGGRAAPKLFPVLPEGVVLLAHRRAGRHRRSLFSTLGRRPRGDYVSSWRPSFAASALGSSFRAQPPLFADKDWKARLLDPCRWDGVPRSLRRFPGCCAEPLRSGKGHIPGSLPCSFGAQTGPLSLPESLRHPRKNTLSMQTRASRGGWGVRESSP